MLIEYEHSMAAKRDIDIRRNIFNKLEKNYE